MKPARPVTMYRVKNTEVITVIGSTKYEDQMIDKCQSLQAEGYLPLMTFIGKKETYPHTEDTLMTEGYKRLSISNFAMCMNVDGYVGDNTAREIHFAEFVANIPVCFNFDIISSKLLSVLNVFFEDDKKQLHLWNEFNTKIDIKTIYIRERPIIHDEVRKFIPISDITNLHKHIADILTDSIYAVEYIHVDIVYLSDTKFENKIKKSKLYIPDKKEE